MGWLGAIAGGVGQVVGSVAGFAAENAGALLAAGSSMYATAATQKAAKGVDYSTTAVESLKEEVPNVEDASKLAAEKIKEKRRDINRSRTIFSSPLGQVDEADISVKTLLGK